MVSGLRGPAGDPVVPPVVGEYSIGTGFVITRNQQMEAGNVQVWPKKREIVSEEHVLVSDTF